MGNARIKHRVDDVPRGRFEKFGYGLAPILHDWDVRIKAVESILEIIDGDKRAQKDNDTAAAFSTVKGLFSRVYVNDCYDWFTVSKMLAYPSHDLAKDIAMSLGRYRGALLAGNEDIMKAEYAALQEMPVADMLANYLDMAVHGKHPIDEKGFASILWSSDKPDHFFINATFHDVDEQLKFVQKRFPGNAPYGVLAAYLIEDAQEVNALLREGLEQHYSHQGLYSGDFAEIREQVEQILVSDKQYRLSPWHGSDPEVEDEVEQKLTA